MIDSFHERVIAVIKKIPRGKVATYGQIAALAGNPRAARQVVRTLHTASRSARLPWHRVINAQGRVSLKPDQGGELQRAMLEKERVRFGLEGAIDLDRYLWKPGGSPKRGHSPVRHADKAKKKGARRLP